MAFSTLGVDLVAKIGSFEEGMNRAVKGVDSLDRRFSTLSASIKGFVGALSVGAVAAFAKSGIDAADAMNDMSQRTGVAVKTLADWQLAATQSDTSMEALAKGVQKLTLSIIQAESGSKVQAESLKRLGITARDPQQAFEQLAEAVASSNDPTRTAADLNNLLGRSYTELLPLLQGGAQGLRDSAIASASFSEAMVKLAPDAAKFNDQLDSLKLNAAGASAALLSELVPAINRVFERFQSISRLRDAGASLFEIITGGVSSDAKSSLDRVQKDIADLEARRSRLGTVRDPATEAELARLKKIRAELIEITVEKQNALQSPASSTPSSAAGNVVDFSKAFASKTRAIDKDEIFSDEMARNAKLIAEETDRIAGDFAFMAQVDLAQNNPLAAIEQEWKDAARAMVDSAKTPLEQFEDRIGYIDELMRRGLLTSDEYGKVMAKAFDDAGASAQKTQSMAQELGLTFTSAFEDAIVSGASFSDMLKGIQDDIARILVRRAITQPLANAIGSLLPSANGNVFANAPGLSAYSGSIVSSPTVFPFAAGIGLMGEAGPEAILPLSRGADGKLGIAGGGSNVQVNVINNASGTQATATQRDEGGMQIIDVMVEQVESKVSRNLSSGRGIAPALERRYGLNPAAGAMR